MGNRQRHDVHLPWRRTPQTGKATLHLRAAHRGEQTAKSDKESMYGYCQRNSPVHRPYHQRSAETDSKGFIKEERIKEEKYQYIDELVTTINEYNDILALWIKMKQGSLSLNIETFELNELFELLRKGSRTFEMKRQSLEVQPTDIRVKADKALTLFMINTLAENARKYTPQGGMVKVYARQEEDYVEISVEDNGCGLSPEDVARIVGEKYMTRKPSV